jgi:hypothetical protein
VGADIQTLLPGSITGFARIKMILAAFALQYFFRGSFLETLSGRAVRLYFWHKFPYLKNRQEPDLAIITFY